MSAFWTGFTIVAGGFLGLFAAVFTYRLIRNLALLPGEIRRQRRKAATRAQQRELALQRKQALELRTNVLLAENEEVWEVVQELSAIYRDGKVTRGNGHIRDRCQRQLRKLVTDRAVRDVIYARARQV